MTWRQPGPGRPAAGDEPLSRSYELRHTASQRDGWATAARVEGMTLAQWIRRELDRAAGQILDRLGTRKP